MQRLVGGSDAPSERFPYMGVFQGPTVGFPEDSLLNPVCSGVLIAPNMVLTSAGCASAIQEDQDERHFGGICLKFDFCIFFGPGSPGAPGPPGPPGPPGGPTSPVEPPVDSPVVDPPVVSPEVAPVVSPEVDPVDPPVVDPVDPPVESPAESPVVSPEVAPVGAPVELPPSVTQFKMGCADGRTGCTDLNIAEVRIFSLGTDDLVGIVLLTEDVEDVAPIKLATHDLHATGQTVTALGWGDTFDAKREGNTRFPALSLQATDLLLLNSDDCQARLTQLDGFFGGNVVAGDNDVCTLSDDPAVLKNVCVGDDAAPLIYACSVDPSQDSLLGFGLGTQACGIPGLPAVFKRTNFAALETFLSEELVGAGPFESEAALPDCLAADVEVPDFTTDLTQWTCDPASFGNLLACDCGCGLSDPDCKFILGCEGDNCVNDECTDDGVDTALPDPTGESGPGGVPAQDPGTSVDNAPSTDEETNPGADEDGEGALGLNDQTLALVMLALVATTVLMLCLITALLIMDRNKTQNNDQQAAVMLSETNAGNSFEEGGSTSKAQGMSGEEAGFSGGEEAGFSDEAGLSNDEEAGISASGAGVSASGAGVSASGAGVSASGAGASGSAGADEAGLSDAAGFSEEEGDEEGFSEEEEEGSKHI